MDSTTATDGKQQQPIVVVDSFLVEALSNPRHRLTILRMELDIQKFLQNPDLQQFEFPHLPTSYLRLAAHRVAQHYGLVTMVQDIGFDGMSNKIVAMKQGESKYPTICLSEIHAKNSESDKQEHVKIAIKPRPNKGSANESNGMKRSDVRSVEKRQEDYEKARARIFSTPSSPESGNPPPQLPTEGKSLCLSRDENESWRSSMIDSETNGGTSSRVAIFRDREKDRVDPDYDRNRFVRGLPTNPNFTPTPTPFNWQNIQVPFVPQYDAAGFPQMVQMARSQASPNYGPLTNPVMSPFGMNQMPRNAAYVQWPTSAMMYAHSYDQFRQAVFQVPYHHQQPLSFDYSQSD
ncbi:hypothetical protein ACFE04_014318 [Oxalis oulophora]